MDDPKVSEPDPSSSRPASGSEAESQPVCYYCQANLAPDLQKYYKQEMYWIEKRTIVPLGYKYIERKIAIPRCADCCDKHLRIGCTSFLISAPIGYAVTAFILYHMYGQTIYAKDGTWFGFALGVLLLGSVAVGGLMWLYAEFVSSDSGIPPAHAIHSHPAILRLQSEGWLLSKPDPASCPEPSANRRKQG